MNILYVFKHCFPIFSNVLEETVRHGFKEEVPSYVRQLVRNLIVLLLLDSLLVSYCTLLSIGS